MNLTQNKAFQGQIVSNPHKSAMVLNLMSTNALKELALDLKAQVNAGLLSDTLASQSLNIITGIILDRESTSVLTDACTDGFCQ